MVKEFQPIVLTATDAINRVLPEANYRTQLEKQGLGWGWDRRSVKQLNSLFATVSPLPLQEVIDERKSRGESTTVFDLMGFGYIFKELRGWHWGVSLSLSDDRSDVQRQNDLKRNIWHVYGNVLNLNAWQELNQGMRLKKIKPFDLIIWAPAAGLLSSHITSRDDVYNKLLHQTWSLLGEEGILLAEMPHRFFHSYERHCRTQQWMYDMQAIYQKVVGGSQGMFAIDMNRKIMMIQKMRGTELLPL